jgi:hypothetical protein
MPPLPKFQSRTAVGLPVIFSLQKNRKLSSISWRIKQSAFKGVQQHSPKKTDGVSPCEDAVAFRFRSNTVERNAAGFNQAPSKPPFRRFHYRRRRT